MRLDATARRRIPLAVIGAAAGIVVIIFGFGLLRGGASASPGAGWLRVGTTKQIQEAHVTFVPSIPAFVVSTPEGPLGLYAKSPHLGEPVRFCASSGYFEDSNSKYDGGGNYALGPSPRGLDRLQVLTSGDETWIYPYDRLPGTPRGTPRISRPLGPFCITG